MAFNKRNSQKLLPENPEILLRDHLRKKKIQGLLSHQADILRNYMINGIDLNDVALQLPTGSGKTLVGLLIAEWQRLSKKKRVLYLCPTRQLAIQVHNMANNVYGIDASLFIGKVKEYSSDACYSYENNESIAISTYSSLFNTNPYFDNPQIIIFDDAHSAENYVSAHWSCEIEREKESILYDLLINNIKSIFPSLDYTKFEHPEKFNDAKGELWVEKLPNPIFYSGLNNIRSIIDSNVEFADSDYIYPWSIIRENLHACQLFFSAENILIRPLIPPTLTHSPFKLATQRIYMSATLGLGGDLERLFGIKNIYRIPAPEGWQKQVIGRRYFIFPERSLDDKEIDSFLNNIFSIFPRALLLTTSYKSQNRYLHLFSEKFGCKIFTQKEIELSKTDFIKSDKAVAILANRFDGIDFPDDECRVLILSGHPKSVNIQELFLMRRFAANIIFEDRIITRLVQSFGRCTRNATDRSIVIVLGDSLNKYLMRSQNRSYLHPEIQAEIEFGIEESKDKTSVDFIENINIFQKNTKDWINADSDIADSVSRFSQTEISGVTSLKESVEYEIDYQYNLWNQNYRKSLENAVKIIGIIKDQNLRGYRALWNYLAGYSGYLLSINSNTDQKLFQEYFTSALSAVPLGIPWLNNLTTWAMNNNKESDIIEPVFNSNIIENCETELAKLGLMKTVKLDSKITNILNNLTFSPDNFESALVELGELLGYESNNSKDKGSPDPWWVIKGKMFIVFEAKNGGKETTIISHKWLKQANGHRNWLLGKSIILDDMKGWTIIISKSNELDETAKVQIQNLLHWNYDDFYEWAKNALNCIRDLHNQLQATGELFWRNEAILQFKKNNIFPEDLIKLIGKKSFSSLKLK